jgi:hypothetical protein
MSAPGTSDLEVEARLILPDAGTPAVGVPFAVEIHARHKPGAIAILPESLGLPDALAERKAARQHRRSEANGVETDHYTLELLGFDPGHYTIPEIPLALSGTVAKTKAIEVDIGTGFSEAELPVATSTRPEALAELEKMAAQDAPPLPVYVDDYRPAYVLVGLLAGAALFYAVMRWWKAKEAAPIPEPPPPPPRPAHEIALEKLIALEREGHLEAGRAKIFFVELSTVMREWAGNRWGFESLDLTVDELLEALEQKPRDRLDKRKLAEILFLADQVKFAKFMPGADDGKRALAEAREIVVETTPPPPPKETP